MAGPYSPTADPWFGPSKTIRGVVLATLATAAAAGVLGLGWKVGALLGVVAMAGDLLASFIKRRLGLAPSSQAVGLDQIPEVLASDVGRPPIHARHGARHRRDDDSCSSSARLFCRGSSTNGTCAIGLISSADANDAA